MKARRVYRIRQKIERLIGYGVQYLQYCIMALSTVYVKNALSNLQSCVSSRL